MTLNPPAADFGGPPFEGCNEHFVLTRPQAIRRIHRSYIDAGADIIETDSFGGTRIVLAEYGLEDKVGEINRTAARLARQVAEAAAPLLESLAGRIVRRFEVSPEAGRGREAGEVSAS